MIHAIHFDIKNNSYSSTLFTKDEPEEIEGGNEFTDYIGPNSLQVSTFFVEPNLKDTKAGNRYQFERLGYFYVDPDTKPDRLVFNRTITLWDSWAKIEKKQGK